MALSNDTLYVADVDSVRLFDRRTGQPRAHWPVANATFINDVTIDANGVVWATDTGISIAADGSITPTGTDAVYRFSADGTPTAVARGAELGGPNGIVAVSDGLIVVSFGSNNVWHIAPDGTQRAFAQLPHGGLDGIVRLADGSFLISSWEARGIYRLDAAGNARLVAGNLEAPAALAYDSRRNRILVPLLTTNRLQFVGHEPW
jgi:sugar lactone lactonase YvrE